MNAFLKSARNFLADDEGAQIIEYALIIAVVSLALILALQAMTADGGSFSTWIGKLGTCLTTAVCE